MHARLDDRFMNLGVGMDRGRRGYDFHSRKESDTTDEWELELN